MTTKALIDLALQLPPAERFELTEVLMQSLDHPDSELDRVWIKEAERRLALYRSGQVTGIPAGDVLGEF